MVVVPTAKHVVLTYGTTKVEWAGRLLTLLGVVGLAALVWWGGVRRRLPWRRRRAVADHVDRRDRDG